MNGIEDNRWLDTEWLRLVMAGGRCNPLGIRIRLWTNQIPVYIYLAGGLTLYSNGGQVNTIQTPHWAPCSDSQLLFFCENYLVLHEQFGTIEIGAIYVFFRDCFPVSNNTQIGDILNETNEKKNHF